MENSKRTVVAFLTLSSDSSVVDFANDMGEKLPNHIFKHVRLSNNVLESFHTQDSEEYDALVLLHSVQEGRNSITDVPDAKYQELLPELKRKYGAGRVAVVVFSMPSLQKSYNKEAMMLAFKRSQRTTFDCSECVIQCNNLHAMFPDYRAKLISFLEEAPHSPLPVHDAIPMSNGETNQSGQQTGDGFRFQNKEPTSKPFYDNSVGSVNDSGSGIFDAKPVGNKETTRAGENTGKEFPFENEGRNSLRLDNRSVALINHPGSDTSDTLEMSKVLTKNFGFTFKPLDKHRMVHINCFKAVLVLVGKIDCEIKAWVATSTSDYRDKLAPGAQLGWLIMGKTDESDSLNESNIFGYSREHEGSSLNGIFKLIGYGGEHANYIFEESTLDGMKKWFTEDCCLEPKPRGWCSRVLTAMQYDNSP